MVDSFDAFGYLIQPWPMFLLILGTSLGVIVGGIPGLTGAMVIALTLPLTYAMASQDALILLVSMYVGSISGGLTTATLLRMPGTPASIMTTLDGYPLAQKGKAGRALGLGVTASLVGGLVSWVFLLFLAKPLADISIYLGPFEFFSLVLMALVLIASVSNKSLIAGLLSGTLGILVTIPGVTPATGQLRWTFGVTELNNGFGLLPVLIGLFAINQIIADILDIGAEQKEGHGPVSGMLLKLQDWTRHGWNLVRSSLIGTWIGILPGIGANIASVMAYTTARSSSKNPEEFGQGSEEGIVASEAANNATVGGALIPLVSLGIPGSVIDAVLLGALVLHDLQPGPLLFKENAEVVWVIIATYLVANLFMFVFMVSSVKLLVRLIQIPREYMIPIILVFCVVGGYALRNNMFDVWVMLVFGFIGFGLERVGIPLAPFVIGLVLAPIAEENLAAGLMQSGGDYWPILTRPLSLLFFLIALGLLLWPFVWKRSRQIDSPNQNLESTGKE
ncbi:MAG: tripartite tricarboxylate transporter permease [Gemmataceae bacterium]